jgi:hypothetical protein
MKQRTGKECKRIKCKNHKHYSNWSRVLSRSKITECMNCKHAHVSQYEVKKQEDTNGS